MKSCLLLLLLAGCGTARTVPGDSYTQSVKNDGMSTWARTVGDEKVCEYFYDGCRWLRVGFDLKEWDDWLLTRCAKVTKADGRIEYVTADPEPKVKWARYDIGAAWRRR